MQNPDPGVHVRGASPAPSLLLAAVTPSPYLRCVPSTILHAPAGSSLSALLLPHLAEALRMRTDAWYLVPYRAVRSRRIRTLARDVALLAPPIGTLDDLVNTALRGAGCPPSAPADDLAAELILRDLIAKELPDAHPGAGLARAALHSIDVLLGDGFTCDSLGRALELLDHEGNDLAAGSAGSATTAAAAGTANRGPHPAHQHIAALWRALHALCPDIDRSAPMRHVLHEHLLESVAPELLLIEGSPLQGELSARVISELIRVVRLRGGHVIAALPAVPAGRGRVARSAAFLQQQLGVAPVSVQGDVDGTSPAIRHLADHLFRPGLPAFGAGDHSGDSIRPAGILTLRAPDAFATADLVAREIVRLMGESRDGWVALDRGVVVVCPTDDDRRLVHRALRRHEIPVGARPHEPMHAHPGGRYLLALLDVLEHGTDAPLDAVLTLLDSDGWGLDSGTSAGLEARLLSHGATRAGDALTALPNRRTRRRLERLLALAAELAAARDITEYTRLVRSAIHPRLARAAHKTCDPVRGAWARHGLAAALDGHRPTPRVRAVAGYARPIRRLDDLMRMLAECARRTATTPRFDEWVHDLRALMMDTELQIGSSPARGVRLERPGAIEPAQVVFVVGLVERRFPRAPRQDPFVPDELRHALGRDFLMAPHVAADVADEERERFLLSCAAARRQLYLCSPKMDDDGHELLPSFFIEDVQRCLGGGALVPLEQRSVRIGNTIPDLEWADGEEELRTAVVAALHDAALPEARRPAVARAFDAVSERDARFRKRLLESMPDYHARVARDESVVYLTTRAERVSHSQLDAYGHCAFQHFVESRLEPEALALPRFDALSQGTIVHQWLWEFAARDGGWNDGGGECFDHAVEMLIARALPAEPASMFASHRSAVEWELLKERTVELLRRERERLAAATLKPAHYELGFGMPRDGEALDPASLPDPLPLRFGDRVIQLSGRIDRVDVAEQRGRRVGVAIDYKLGSVDRYARALERNEELQLFLYLRALGAWGTVPVGALYLSVRDNETAGIVREEYATQLGPLGDRVTVVDRDRWRALRHAANEEVARRHALMERGIIEARPRDWDCGYCELRDVCRIDLWKARADE